MTSEYCQILLPIFIFIAIYVVAVSGSQLKTLLQGEDVHIMPLLSANETLRVTLGLHLLKIIEVVRIAYKSYFRIIKTV